MAAPVTQRHVVVMPIQWFPGHMTSARRKAAETMARTDLVVEVLDARIPAASANPMIEELRAFRQRPCLKVLNKVDLADPVATREWMAHFDAQDGVRAFAISCKQPADVARLPAQFQALAPHRNDGTKPLRIMVMGIPNVGKSTLLNALLKRRVAKVGDEPAVTKSQQTFDLAGHMTVTDTPGMMWPKIAHDSDGFMLAICHAIGRNAVIDEEVALALADILLARYPAEFSARYTFAEPPDDAFAALTAVGKRRGCLIKGGGIDLEKAANVLLTDFRSGALGRISLETPASRAAMLAAARAAGNEGATP